MAIDVEIFEEYSRFVDWEGDPKWINVSMDASTARDLGIDEHWAQCFTEDLPIGKCVSRLWAGVQGLMPRTAAAFAAKASGLAVLRTKQSGNSLVYFLGDGDNMALRRGFSPTKILPPVSVDLTTDLSPFYRLHDGLVNFMSYDGGLLPTAEWRTVVDQGSGRASLIEVATDGSEGFGFDISEQPVQGYVLRPSEGEVNLVTDVWAYLDELMASPIESI